MPMPRLFFAFLTAWLLFNPVPGNAIAWNDSTLVENNSVNQLQKPPEAGDRQHQRVNLQLEKPVRVKVTKGNVTPVAGQTVQFEIISQPKKSVGFIISPESAVTDSAGIATTTVQLGSEPGDYQLIAKIDGDNDQDFQVFTFQARRKNWIFMLIIGLLGGLGLFLLGMEMMSEGMKKAAGDRMRSILGSLTRNRILALGLGTFVTMVIQSSSATSVMLVGFVNSRLMKFRRTIAILLGANIGTTVTAQLIAFNISEYSLLMIAIGFALLYFSKKPSYKYLGQSLLGFGILFFGMQIMSDAMVPLRSFSPFIDLLQELENPLLGIAVGVMFTALIQSSGAFIGICIVLASQGLLTLEAAIPLLLGSNIGTAITAFLASIKASREAKKVALANALVNVFGMILVVGWIPGYAGIVETISPRGAILATDSSLIAEAVPRQIANAHTLFNVILAVLILPLTNQVAWLIDRILPEEELEETQEMKAIFLDENLISTPALGLNLAKQEALRIAGIVQDMLGDVILPFVTKEPNVLEDLEKRERLIDFLAHEVTTYLMKISRQETVLKRANEAFQIMYTVKELEEIADITGNLLVKRAKVWIGEDVDFSEQGKKELLEYHVLAQKQLSRAIEVFRDLNLEKAKEMKAKHKKYRSIASEMEKNHYERLREAAKLEVSGDTHLELMTRLRMITHHATNIARILLDWKLKLRPEA